MAKKLVVVESPAQPDAASEEAPAEDVRTSGNVELDQPDGE
jgi:hypothetical protein